MLKQVKAYLGFFFGFIFSVVVGMAQGQLPISGLDAEVKVFVDPYGVPHIYATTVHDLFFAQGFHAASDRLFQFELWRRQARGLVSELLGEKELNRDIGARLFRYRGNMDTELNHYHPDGHLIIHAFVEGVNAAIDQALLKPDSLPLEFRLMGLLPGHFKVEDVVSRHQGLLGNLLEEWETAQMVVQVGEEKTKELNEFHPYQPDLHLDSSILPVLRYPDVPELYRAFRRPLSFQSEAISLNSAREPVKLEDVERHMGLEPTEFGVTGSNNWAVSGNITESGYPMLANDPHRTLSAPSLRYIAHLHGPGWHVIGGGEPTIPGISIGHNDYGAWGLTIHATDAEDMYVYQIQPGYPHRYLYRGQWREMIEIRDSIPVKGKGVVPISLFYTVHGPVLKIIPELNKAVAVRCAWLEPGGAPYLASLRMNQAKTWEDFRLACAFSHIPGENMLWADRSGTIGWQTVGIAPLRNRSSGMVPVPGDGSRDWDGFMPILERPHRVNPPENMLITANEQVAPRQYKYPKTLAYSWAEPYRGLRIREFLSKGKALNMIDFMTLQSDYASLPARDLLGLVKHIPFSPKWIKYRSLLDGWDGNLTPRSIAATVYDSWERTIFSNFKEQFIPEVLRSSVNPTMTGILDALIFPDARFGPKPVEGRNAFLERSLENAMQNLEKKLGKDMSSWVYGQSAYKHVHIRHPLSAVVSPAIREILDVGPAPRGGNGYTVNVTGKGDNQTHGASFRFIADLKDWDRCLATNTPGQSGDPVSPFYRNLFPLWVENQYFPLYFFKHTIEALDSFSYLLKPK